MTCKCFEYADTVDLIEELLDRGYYVDKSDNLLRNMEADDMIEELKKRGYNVTNGEVEQLYYDAITHDGKLFKQKLNYFFEKTIGKRL